MLNKKKVISFASAGLALVAITGSAFAASNINSTSSNQPANQVSHQKQHQDRGFGFFNNQELLTLLNIDANTLQQDLKAGKSLAEIASAQGVEEQKVIDLFTTKATERLTQEIAAGKLTQDQADQMKSNMQDRMKTMVESKGGLDNRPGFKGHGGPGFEGRGEHGFGGPLQEAVDVLGITQQDLQTQLKAGKSLAQIAQDKGISKDDLINKLLEKDKERITKMVDQTWPQKNSTKNNNNQSTANQQ